LAIVDEVVVVYSMMRINDGVSNVGRMEELEEQDSNAIDDRMMLLVVVISWPLKR